MGGNLAVEPAEGGIPVHRPNQTTIVYIAAIVEDNCQTTVNILPIMG